jgi:hypothetical protein
MKLLFRRLRHMLTPLAGADQAVDLALDAFNQIVVIARLAQHDAVTIAMLADQLGMALVSVMRSIVISVHKLRAASWAVRHQACGVA